MPPAPQRRSLGALAVAAGIFLSRVAGLVRTRVFAHYLGNSPAAGAFNAALRIPNLLQNLFGEGVLSASFIPVYARLLAEKSGLEAARVARVVATLLALCVSLLAALGTLATPLLIDLIAPGFRGEVRALTIDLVRIMFPGIALLVMAAWCLGVLNSHRRFFLPYAAPVLWNLVMIGALVAWGGARRHTGAGQASLAVRVAWAAVAGSALQLAVQLPAALRLLRAATGGERSPHRALDNPHVRQVLRSFVPIVTSRGVVQLSAYIDQLLASFLGAPIVAALGYAATLYLLPISLFGMSVSAAELPEMSGELGTPEEVAARLRARLSGALGRIAFFVVPSAAGFLLVGDVIVGALFQTGEFGRADTMVVWMILAGSTVGLLAATQANLFRSTFYALRDTRTPLGFAVLRVSLTGLLGYLIVVPLRARFGLAPGVAAAGLTASAGLAGWLEYLLLRRALLARIGRFGIGAGRMLALWAAALAAGGAGFGLARVLPAGHPVWTGALVVTAFATIYGAVALAIGVREATDLYRGLRRRIVRR